MTTVSGDYGSRRLSRRRAPGSDRPGDPLPTPSQIGYALSAARKSMGIDLIGVHDRTGVLRSHLEAVEAGDFSVFLGVEDASIAVRRFADIVLLDPIPMLAGIQAHWDDDAPPSPITATSTTSAPTRVAGRGARQDPPTYTRQERASETTVSPAVGRLGPPRSGSGQISPSSTRPSPVPERAFANTGEIPAVGAPSPNPDRGGYRYASGQELSGDYQPSGDEDRYGRSYRYDDSGPRTGSYPTVAPLRIHPARRHFGRMGRTAVWLAVLVTLGAGAYVPTHRTVNRAVGHVPHWPGEIGHAISSLFSSPGGTATTSSSSNSTTGTTTAPMSAVQETSTGTYSSTVTVSDSTYAVQISATGPCWVEAVNPSTEAKVFAQTMTAGEQQVLTPPGGQLSVEIGSSKATVVVTSRGKVLPGWSWQPKNVPFTLNFTSAAAAATNPFPSGSPGSSNGTGA